MTLTPQAFVAKWKRAELSESSAAQQHFLDVCELVGHETPADADSTGKEFAFEMGVAKTSGGEGWADVAKLDFFGWEYKGKHADLDKAYQQLLLYREALQNPPLLVVCDIERIIIHTNFTYTPKRTVTLTLDDLLTAEGFQRLHDVFFEPEKFRSAKTTQQVTEDAAAQFGRLASILHKYGEAPQATAHFLMRLVFVLFASDVGLLPQGVLKKLADATRHRTQDFTRAVRQLFQAMAKGGFYGSDLIKHFDGGLFEDDSALDLDSDCLDVLREVDQLDWSSIEPSIFGTLFERSLDPGKRAQLGAHYTSKDDILLIVEPVLMAPLRRRWADVQVEARALAEKRDGMRQGAARDRVAAQLLNVLLDFGDEIARTRVLDPCCGAPRGAVWQYPN